MQFSQLQLSDEILRAVESVGYTEMTEVQEKLIPLMLEGKDVIGRSNTGTGKTAAFAIPLLMSISKDEKQNRKIEGLVLCPTRELAMQAADEIRKFAKFMPWIRVLAVFGGASMENQIRELKRGVNIVIGTPGRVIDHINRRTLKLENINVLVLDEADEMLNMGFREDIETILESVPEERQTALFSATMPPEILNITKNFQKPDAALVKIKTSQRTVDTISQFYYEVPPSQKTDALKLLLLYHDPQPAMIFCNTKSMVDELAEILNAGGFKALGLHGDMKQATRTTVMNAFKNGRIHILIATDVAARGIDVSGIDSVFNYDLPQDKEYYIHRIGRTGRAGKSGTAHTLISNRRQLYDLRDIAAYNKAAITQKDLPSRDDIINSKISWISEKIVALTERDIRPEADEMINEILKTSGVTERELLQSIVSQTIIRNIKNIPDIKITPVAQKKSISFPKKSDKLSTSGFENKKPRRKSTLSNPIKLNISIGRADRVAPRFILAALAQSTGYEGNMFGKIDIFERYSTVEVDEKDVDYIINSINNGKIYGKKVNVKLHN